MNLIYVYIKKVANNLLCDKGFKFSREYDIEMKNDRIEISSRDNYLNYERTVYNISAIVGENGSGKSTIIQAIRDCKIDNKDIIFYLKIMGNHL